MSFEDLEPAKKGAKPGVPVKVGLIKMRGARARATLIIRRDILEPLGGKCWRYRIALGKGENAHQVAVTQADDGPFEAAEFKGVFLLRLPVVERFPDEKRESVECSFRVVEQRCILVDMPSWAWKTPPKIGAGRP